MKTKIISPIMYVFFLFPVLLVSCSTSLKEKGRVRAEQEHPKIVNIINFIRLLEPRHEEVTEQVLYQTVASQVEIMQKYHLGGTFLLQYDALLDSRYQKLLKSLPDSTFEIGAWLEIPQPLVEHAGMKWRGRYQWDWHANVGFLTGYSPSEREKLVDVYMAEFKRIFGYYPKSVGCWFIDAHSLKYMHDKYHIVAACICRDQVGTDGYTLWGGYWNQGYYPSVKNSYMPAQNEQNQIPVPVFRMLGSDPVRQYDSGLGSNHQGVITLEPSYENGGGDSVWVNWYFKEFVEGACMEYAYVQAGQENSFTWQEMSKGLEIQIPLIARLKHENKVKVETLSHAGQWFRNHYKTTPATSVTVEEDLPGGNAKTVWFNSRYYRANLIWENNTFRFRDIHLFDEDVESPYLVQRGTSEACSFYTLPFVDGFNWSSVGQVAGLRLKAMIDRKEIQLKGEAIQVDDSVTGKLQILWPLTNAEGVLTIDMDEKQFSLNIDGGTPLEWYLEFTSTDNAILPFKTIDKSQIRCHLMNTDYIISCTKGAFTTSQNARTFRIEPEQNRLVLSFSHNEL